MKKYWVTFLSLMLMAPSAIAGARFSLVGGVNYGLDSASASVGGVTATVESGIGYGGGLLVGIGALELGGIFLSRNYTTAITGLPETTSSISVVEIPVMARIGGGAATFGIGGFYDVATTSNYGLTAGPRFGGNNGGLFIDLRFNYGLKTGNSKDALALVGYSFGKK